MQLEDINFGFLWEEKKGVILGAKHPFDEKWDEEYLKYRQYVKSATIEEVIWLMIFSYRDNFPRDYWTALMAKGMASKHVKKEGNYDTIAGEHFVHKEIALYKDIEVQDQEGFGYVIERILLFNKDLNLKDIVEDVISEKIFTKDRQANKTIYKLTDSPIDTISITNDSFEMKINESKYVRHSY